MKQKSIIIAVIVVILAIAVFATYYSMNNQARIGRPDGENNSSSATNPANSSTASPIQTPPTPTITAENTIVVGSQTAGKTVIIDELNLGKPGFIVIFENNNGKPGKLVGTSNLISAGAKIDLVVNAPVVNGAQYIAMIYSDDGNKKFDITKDAANTNAGATKIFSVK